MTDITFEQLCQTVIGEFSGETLIISNTANGKTIYNKQQYLDRIDQFAEQLAERLKKYPAGTWVGLCCRNSPDWIALLFAVAKCGCSPVLLNSEWSSVQINAYIQKLSIPVILDDDAERAKLLSAEQVLLFPQDLKSAGKTEISSGFRWAEKLAFVTSGTTSEPKLYIFQAESLIRQTCCIAENPLIREIYPLERIKRFMQILPLRHCFGLGTIFALWRLGITAVFPENLGVLTLLKTVRDEQINCIASVPAVWKALLSIVCIRSKSKEITPENFCNVFGDTMIAGICAGARTDERLQQNFASLPFPMLNGWGMTETGIALFGAFGTIPDSHYAGELIPGTGYELQLLQEDGTLSAQGIGELLINGDCLHQETIVNGKIISRSNTWFHTGDIFEIQGTHFLFHGRCKSVIINENGENLYPEELEEQFASVIPETLPFCIVGYDEKPVLFLDGTGLHESDIEVLVNTIRVQNRTLHPSVRLKQIYISEQPLLRTSKGELARFRLMNEFFAAPHAYKQIILQKG